LACVKRIGIFIPGSRVKVLIEFSWLQSEKKISKRSSLESGKKGKKRGRGSQQNRWRGGQLGERLVKEIAVLSEKNREELKRAMMDVERGAEILEKKYQ